MKKSQILAAIALAFALGVVAPVATISNSASVSALSFEAGKETATGTDIANAVKAVKANPNYTKAMALVDAYTEYTAGIAATPKKYEEFNASKAKAVITNMEYIVEDYSVDDITSSTVNADITIEDAQAIINDAKANEVYTTLAAVATAAEGDDKQALIDAVEAYYAAANTPEADRYNFSADVTTYPTFASVKAAIDNDATAPATAKKINYADASDVTTAIEAAQANIDAYNAGFALLNPLASDQSILTAAGKTAYEGAQTPANAKQGVYTLSTLASLINTDSNFDDGFKPNEWSAVEAQIIRKYDNGATKDNFTLLRDIASKYITATDSTKKESVVMAELADFQGEDSSDPSTPEGTNMVSGGNVTIWADGFKFPAGTKVVVKEVAAKDIEGFAGFGELKNNIYDIEIQNADGSKFDMTGKRVTVIITVDGYTEKAEAFHIENGSANAIKDESYKNGTMVFTTDHFSYYAVVEPATDGIGGGSNVTPGDTGTVAQAEGTASATGILAGIAAALTAAGAGVVAFRNARRNSKKNA